MSVIEETLKRTFGFKTFKPGQRQVIEKITAGKSAASIFPTGAGKSLCYQLPGFGRLEKDTIWLSQAQMIDFIGPYSEKVLTISEWMSK